MSNTTRALEKIFKRLVVPKINGIYDRLGIDNSIRIEVDNKVGERVDRDEFVDAYFVNIYFRNGGASHGVYLDLGTLLYLASKYIVTDRDYALVIYYIRGELKDQYTIYSSYEYSWSYPKNFEEVLKNIEDSLSPLES